MSVQQIGQSFLYAKAPHTLGGVAGARLSGPLRKNPNVRSNQPAHA